MSITRERPQERSAERNGRADEAERAPRSPSHLTARSWGGVFKRTVTEFRRDNLTDLAAALTYYGVLAIFPAIIALVSILGLIGQSATQPLIENLGKVAPGPAKQIFTSAIQNLNKSQGAAGIIFIASGAFALYVANFSSYNKTYGALAGIIVFLVWLWISNIAILLGAEFNAELERGRFIEAGNPPEREPFIEPRDTRKMEDKEVRRP